MLLGIAGLWAAGGMLTLDDEPWLSAIPFAFAAKSLYVSATNLLYPATLRLDHAGVHFRHWRIAWFVAWVDIAEVLLFTVRVNGGGHRRTSSCASATARIAAYPPD